MMCYMYRHCETPNECLKQTKMTREKRNISSVILNEVKNLCSWFTFCYNAILHFFQNDMGEGNEGQKACLSLRDPKDCIKQTKMTAKKVAFPQSGINGEIPAFNISSCGSMPHFTYEPSDP